MEEIQKDQLVERMPEKEKSQEDALTQRLLAYYSRLRKDAGISQTALEEISGITRQTINRYESGKVMPTLRAMNRLLLPLGYQLKIVPIHSAAEAPEEGDDACSSCCNGVEDVPEIRMKLVTFNIRCDYDQDGGNSFRFRKGLILKKIQEEQPDVICFQEVLPHVADWLKEQLLDYTVMGCGRSREFADEQVTIAYKKLRFDLVAFDTFWLSEEPNRPGSRYSDQSICPRTAAEALLFDRRENVLWRICNTHLDHEGSQARRLGLLQILNRLSNETKFPEALTVLTGDFNACPEAEEMASMREHPEFFDAAASVGGTFHAFGKERPEGKIDYVYLCKPLCVMKALRWEDCVDGVYLSDHYPVAVEIASVREQ